MVPSAGSARPQLKRGLMSSALIWRTRSSMMRLLTESKAPGGHKLGRSYRLCSFTPVASACHGAVGSIRVAAILGGRHNDFLASVAVQKSAPFLPRVRDADF